MRRSMPLKVDPVLLREPGKRAKAENRTLAQYVETVLRRDLARKLRKAKKPMIELRGPVPAEIRKWKSIPIPGEPERKRKAREKLVHTILKGEWGRSRLIRELLRSHAEPRADRRTAMQLVKRTRRALWS